jgi:hypothetical protein
MSLSVCPPGPAYEDVGERQIRRLSGGIRTEIIELQKLLLDFVLHPMSF